MWDYIEGKCWQWLYARIQFVLSLKEQGKKKLIMAESLKGRAFITLFAFLCPFKGDTLHRGPSRRCIYQLTHVYVQWTLAQRKTLGEEDKKNKKKQSIYGQTSYQPLISVWLHFKKHSSALKSDRTVKMEIGFINSDWEVKSLPIGTKVNTLCAQPRAPLLPRLCCICDPDAELLTG